MHKVWDIHWKTRIKEACSITKRLIQRNNENGWQWNITKGSIHHGMLHSEISHRHTVVPMLGRRCVLLSIILALKGILGLTYKGLIFMKRKIQEVFCNHRCSISYSSPRSVRCDHWLCHFCHLFYLLHHKS